MQWNTSTNAGFSTKKPWLPVPPSYKTHNVATEDKDPNSILNFYKKLLKLRGTNPALLDGEYVALNEGDPNVLAYLRKLPDRAVVVALNFTAQPQTVKMNATGGKTAQPLLTTASGEATQQGLDSLKLEPFGVFVGEITK
jgi:alpha-glucosidase